MAGTSWLLNAEVLALQLSLLICAKSPFRESCLGWYGGCWGQDLSGPPMKKRERGVLISLERSLYSEFD